MKEKATDQDIQCPCIKSRSNNYHLKETDQHKINSWNIFYFLVFELLNFSQSLRKQLEGSNNLQDENF